MGILVAIVLLALVTGIISFGSGGLNVNLPSQTGAVANVESEKTIRTDKLCGDDNLADIEVRWRNGANLVTADYNPSVLTLVDSGTNDIIRSLTTTADGTFLVTANALECGKSYFVVVNNNATNVASKSGVRLADSSIVRFDVVGANSSQIVGNMYSLSFVNQTNTAIAFATGSQDFATVTNHALGTGDSITIRFEIGSQDSNAQFGASERLCETDTGVCGKAFACMTGASSIYGLDDLSMSAPFVVGRLQTLPKLCATSTPSNAGVGRVAFELDAIMSAGGRQSGTYFVKSGLGDAGDTQNARIIYMDNNYYQGSSGKLKIGTADDTSTDTGETNRYMEIDIT